MAKPLPIRTDVSPSLRPEILDHRAPALTGRSAGALAAAQQVLEYFYRNQSLIMAAREAEYSKVRSPQNLRALQAARDGKQKPSAEMIMGKQGKLELALNPRDAKAFNEAADAAFLRGAAVYEANKVKIVQELEQLHSERAAKASDPAANSPKGLAMAAELRAHLKGLTNAERVNLIRAEIRAGNVRLADAVVSAESFLSGLDQTTHATLVAETHSRFAPEETSKIENLVAVLSSVDNAASIAVKAYGDALVPVIGHSEAANAALNALKTGEE